MKKVFLALILITTMSLKNNDKKSINYVPDKATAKKIAEAIWVPLYGEGVKLLTPYQVYSVDNDKVWLVEGSLPEGELGGVPIIKINKKDCRIIEVAHSK